MLLKIMNQNKSRVEFVVHLPSRQYGPQIQKQIS